MVGADLGDVYMKFKGKIENEILSIYTEDGNTIFHLMSYVGIRKANGKNPARFVMLSGTNWNRRKVSADEISEFKNHPDKIENLLSDMRKSLA